MRYAMVTVGEYGFAHYLTDARGRRLVFRTAEDAQAYAEEVAIAEGGDHDPMYLLPIEDDPDAIGRLRFRLVSRSGCILIGRMTLADMSAILPKMREHMMRTSPTTRTMWDEAYVTRSDVGDYYSPERIGTAEDVTHYLAWLFGEPS